MSKRTKGLHMNSEGDFLSRPEAADYCKQKFGSGSTKTLAKFASQGLGPAYVKFGGRALYRRADLDAWFATKAIWKRSTSDEGRPLSKLPEATDAPVA